MSWQVEFAPAAVRDLDRLPPKVVAAVVTFATGTLCENPYRLSKPLQRDLVGYYSARRGDYRILFSAPPARRVLTIQRIAHRSDVYRRGGALPG